MARRRRNPGAGEFFTRHPWMTFFLGMATLETIRVAVRGWPDLHVGSPTTPALSPSSSSSATPAVASLGWVHANRY